MKTHTSVVLRRPNPAAFVQNLTWIACFYPPELEKVPDAALPTGCDSQILPGGNRFSYSEILLLLTRGNQFWCSTATSWAGVYQNKIKRVNKKKKTINFIKKTKTEVKKNTLDCTEKIITSKM